MAQVETNTEVTPWASHHDLPAVLFLLIFVAIIVFIGIYASLKA